MRPDTENPKTADDDMEEESTELTVDCEQRMDETTDILEEEERSFKKTLVNGFKPQQLLDRALNYEEDLIRTMFEEIKQSKATSKVC